jgi:hypothetical protein
MNEPEDTDDDQVNGNHVVEEARDKKDQYTGDESDQRLEVRNRDHARSLL